MIKHHLLDNGIFQYTFWDPASSSPASVMWVHFFWTQNKKNVGLVMNIITVESQRRKGFASQLLGAAREHCDFLMTASGSADGGEALITKVGFVHDPMIDMWVLHK